MKIRKPVAGILIGVFLIVAIHVARHFLIRNPEVQAQIPEANTNPKAHGNPQAEIHIVEYTDFQCPACKKGAFLLADLFKKFPDKVYVEYRHFPISAIHRHALKAAIYAECAAKQDKFWPFHDLLFAKSKWWGRGISAEWRFDEMAQEVGLNLNELHICKDKEDIEKTVMTEKEAAGKMGVRATPTYFINGKMIVGPKSLITEVEKLLGIKSERPADDHSGHNHAK